ncbi:hypothetical protein ACFX11_039926 [Malus domestica]
MNLLNLTFFILPKNFCKTENMSGAFEVDKDGNLVFHQNQNSEPDEFQQFQKQFNSSMQWGVALSVVSGLVATIAIVAIVYAIIDCLKKTGSAIPAYARIANGYSSIDKSSNANHSSDDVAIDLTPELQQVRSSQVEFPTVRGFLSNMAREKPVAFSPKQLAEYTDNYSTILGSGGFGVVFKGILPHGVQVAVKVLTNTRDKIVEDQFMAEVGTLGRTYHMNLVKLYGFCFDHEMRALVYEYMENGSLDKFLFSEHREIGLEKLHDIAVQTAKGLAYLHEECEQRIIHYDIKPGNVLLDRNLTPKVADFGLAKLCNRGSSEMLLTKGRGTPGYAAPEMWKPFPVTQKCDVYSFGMLLFEIVGRRRNFAEDVNESREWLPRWIWNMFDSNKLEEALSFCGIEEQDREKAERIIMVALLCIQHSPEARPLMSNVVQMLEGDKEIASPPSPFQHLQSPQGNLTQDSGTDEDLSSSASGTKTSEQSERHSNTAVQNKCEIELAAV